MQKRVLLIDDDSEDHEVFIEQLSKYNADIKVISAFNGKQGLELLSAHDPTWIFLDINMPGMNGMDVLKKIKETKTGKNIPVIMYSTSDGYNSKHIALELGATDYVRKPNTENGYVRIFRQILSEPKTG